jgi:hypothetical protein
MRQTVLDQLRNSLQPGHVYRRADLAHLSSNLDRHLKLLVDAGELKKLRNGLYACPKQSSFGEVPPDEASLVSTFLRSERFLVYTPNLFNSLELGTTQLYNRRVVLNQKRHGEFVLGGRNYFFHRRLRVPRQLTREVLLVELLNHLKDLAEDPSSVLSKVQEKLSSFDQKLLKRAAKQFGTYSTQRHLDEMLKNAEPDAA